MTTDYYKFFNIQPGASATDIKLKYRKLSFQYHPDHEGSIEDMTRLNEAYQILSNPLLRREYDQKRQTIHHTQTHSSQKQSYTEPVKRTSTYTQPNAARTRPSSAFYAAKATEKTKTGNFWKIFNTVLVVSLLFFVYETYAVLNPSSSDNTSTVATTSVNPTDPSAETNNDTSNAVPGDTTSAQTTTSSVDTSASSTTNQSVKHPNRTRNFYSQQTH